LPNQIEEKEEINGHQLIRKNHHPENRCTLAAGGNSAFIEIWIIFIFFLFVEMLLDESQFVG
jgi:hypothetical protein